jgi:hypothetical protein
MPEATAGSARFVEGSILRHVVTMSATGSVGLMAIFVVDFLSLLYVSKRWALPPSSSSLPSLSISG